MKKSIALLFAALALLVSLTACSSEKSASAAAGFPFAMGGSTAAVPQGARRDASGSAAGAGAGEGLAKGKRSVVGKVESIVGNEATLLLALSGDTSAAAAPSAASASAASASAASASGRGGAGAGRAAAYSFGEETAVYLLPVGMRIGSGTFSAVKAGNVLSIAFDERADGSEYIVSVRILS